MTDDEKKKIEFNEHRKLAMLDLCASEGWQLLRSWIERDMKSLRDISGILDDKDGNNVVKQLRERKTKLSVYGCLFAQIEAWTGSKFKRENDNG